MLDLCEEKIGFVEDLRCWSLSSAGSCRASRRLMRRSQGRA
jgi:hypothetical protein